MSDTISIKPLLVQFDLDQMRMQSQAANDNNTVLADIQSAQIKEGYTADEYAQQHLRLAQTITALSNLMDVEITHIAETSETIQGL
ncbi:MAG: hypothetical protein FWG40_11375 [Peptococcaceae bacterium]|nr:hypothetical protein [Peptococcaceae bacterium]